MGARQAYGLVLAGILGAAVCAAQTPPAAPPATPPAANAPGAQQAETPAPSPALLELLKIFVLNGEGGVNILPKKLYVTPVVEVRDENDRIVESADVVFRVPPTGPGGAFAQQATRRTRTNAMGQAAGAGFAANEIVGPFQMRVSAQIGNRIGSTVINMRNELAMLPPEPKKGLFSGKRKWIWITGAAAGATVAAILLTRDGSSTQGISITPGPITIGGPR